MASMNRPKIATHVINEDVVIDTPDSEDHTFCGIVFPIQAKTILPVDRIVIKSVSVRGALGDLTVWVTKNEEDHDVSGDGTRSGRQVQYVRHNVNGRGDDSNVKMGAITMKENHWKKIYEKSHRPSFRSYCELSFESNPIILKPGEIRAIYIHSTMDSDQAIVYDNQRSTKTHDDNFLSVLPGRAHVSTKVFGKRPIWGWGNPWRDNREFVGKVSYGVIYKLWNPSQQLSFGDKFRHLARTLFMMQRRRGSPFAKLPDDCIFYILNMCKWDWVNDDFNNLRSHKKRMREIEEAARAEEENVSEENGPVNENEEEQGNVDDSEDEEHAVNISDDVGSDEVEDDDADADAIMQEVEEVEEVSSYDSDFAEDSDSDSEPDDGYDDHRGSSRFQFFYYDDMESDDEERAARALREREEERRLAWLRAHRFVQVVNYDHDDDDDDDDEEYEE